MNFAGMCSIEAPVVIPPHIALFCHCRRGMLQSYPAVYQRQT